MDYLTFSKHCNKLDLCIEILSCNDALRGHLLESESLYEFSDQLYSCMPEREYSPCKNDINTWLELSLHVKKPLSVYKPKINLDLAEIHGPAKAVILVLSVLGYTAARFNHPPFGGWYHWLLDSFSGKQKPGPRELPGISLKTISTTDIDNMKATFNLLAEETWRLYIDWEDQELGADVYDTGSHGGEREPGYLGNVLKAHELAASMLGREINIEEYEQLHNASFSHIFKKPLYDTTPRNLWRLRHLMDINAYEDIDPACIRYVPHQYWEVAAFNFLYNQYPDRFRQENPHVAEYFENKYGNNPTLTKRILNQEFMHCHICFFNEHHEDEEIRQAIRKRLVSFYHRMHTLGYDHRHGLRSKENEDTGLQEIADLVRWLEILHPFRGGNTRLNIILLNKLLVESGFYPVIMENCNDAPYRSAGGWKDQIVTGMLRWKIISSFIQTDLYQHLLQIRPQEFIYHGAATPTHLA